MSDTFVTVGYKRASDIEVEDVIRVGGRWRPVLDVPVTDAAAFVATYGQSIPQEGPETANTQVHTTVGTLLPSNEATADLLAAAFDQGEYLVVRVLYLEGCRPGQIDDRFVIADRSYLFEVQRTEQPAVAAG